MFNKVFKFLQGYVIIEMSGSSTERFLNICMHRGIALGSIQRDERGLCVCRVLKKDFGSLRPVARKTKTKIRIVEKRGLYHFAALYGNRYFFMGAAAAAVIFMIVMSQFVWLVEINGVYEASYAQIEEILKNCGVYPGAPKRKIPSGRVLQDELIGKTDNISWAWVYIEGSKARVEIYEKTLPPVVADKDSPCDIIAGCDAFVENIDARRGKSVVPDGNAVEKGDLLISGTVPVFREGDLPKYMFVHAAGEVRALTYHEKSGEYKEYQEVRIPTGRMEAKCSLELFGKLFRLYGKEEPSFSDYDREDIRRELNIPMLGYSGICLNVMRFAQVSPKRRAVSADMAKEMAREDLEQQIAREFLKDTQKLDETVECERVDEETIRVTVKMTCIENIGVEREITDGGVDMFDKPTD